MSATVLIPYRVLPANLAENFRLKMRVDFSSTEADPGARHLGSGEYSLGTDSDWNPDVHDLTIECLLGDLARIAPLFEQGGIAAADAVLLIALEWTSQDSAARRLGPVARLTRSQLPDVGLEFRLSLTLPAGTVRGTGMVVVQMFLGDPGTQADSDLGLARQMGLRLGALSGRIYVVVDGDGSLFPVQEEALGSEGALWEMRIAWSDPREEPFEIEYVALVLNRDHELFGQLRDRQSVQGRQTPLMRHVLASWIALLVHEVRSELGMDFDSIVSGQVHAVDFASIAEAAAAFVRSGELDMQSAPALFASTQRWLDRRAREMERIA